MLEPQSDLWSEWLLHRRHADDPEVEARLRTAVGEYADHVLDAAELLPGMTLLDVGSGDGLLAFGAIARVGPSIRATLTDISAPMLQVAMQSARRRNVAGQCRFLECSAEQLVGVGDATIDAIVTRSSLAYVSGKSAAFGEFLRVLKPGGRFSIAEPVFQDEAFYARALRRRVSSAAATPQDLFMRLLHRWKAAQFPDTEEGCAACPLVNYSERDLVDLARAAGFTDIHLQLHIDVVPPISTSWAVFLACSPHPWAPSLATIIAQRFSAQERQFFEATLRPIVESGRDLSTVRMAYMNGNKPPDLRSDGP
jgi:ubiquinone/menaquinone biosynthesis C-methylase UbiE